MKTIIIIVMLSPFPLMSLTSINRGESASANNNSGALILDEIPTVFEYVEYRACLSVWTVTVDRTVGSDGWLLEKLGLPVVYTDYSCELGGQFVCPTPECLALLNGED